MGSYETYYDDGCAENPFGLDSSSDQLIHLPSLAVSLIFALLIAFNAIEN